ncbi:MAG: protein arginine kinase [Bacillota bacterium]
MSLGDIIDRTSSTWMKADAPSADVVLSSRVRLARNLEGIPFPHQASDADLARVADQVQRVIRAVRGLSDLVVIRLSEAQALDRQILVEKHLISPQHAQGAKHRLVAIRADETISVMVNEEDHIRIQALLPGLQLEDALKLASEVDDMFESKLDYAFDEKLGYIAACPTNTGTGLRASVMVHLPALATTGQVGRVLTAVSNVGIAVRGLYGEGTEATGNLFQLSNQVALGRSEGELVENLAGVTRQVIDQERNVRDRLVRERRDQLEDKVNRAYGLLSHARLITSEEALGLLSDVRLGVESGLLSGVDAMALNELMVITQPAYLQRIMGKELGPQERDVRRAALIRERIRARKEGK